MQGRLCSQRRRKGARQKWGVTDLDRKYGLMELAGGDVMFAATAVTDGAMLRGVRRFAGGAHNHSVIHALQDRHHPPDRGDAQLQEEGGI